MEKAKTDEVEVAKKEIEEREEKKKTPVFLKSFCNKGLQGITFGVMEGIVMALGLIAGLSVTQDRTIILLGLVVSGLADSLANSAGFHISEETESYHTKSEVYASTIFTFMATFFAFVIIGIPVLIFEPAQLLFISGILAALILIVLGYIVGKIKGSDYRRIILEYLIIAAITTTVCYYLGGLVYS